MKNLYLFGGGGHSLSCIDIIQNQKIFNIKGVFDKNFSSKKKILSYPLIKEDTLLIKKLKGKNFGLVTVGQIKTPNLRIKIFSKMKEYGFKPATVISSNSKIYKNVKIGEGTIIMHNAFVNSSTNIGFNCIINSKAHIEHDVSIGDHTHISTGAFVNGGVKIGLKSFIGSGVITKQCISIPMYPELDDDSIRYISKNLSKYK